jgi:hypothetical protein
VYLSCFIVPEPLMILLFDWHAPHILGLFQAVKIISPAWWPLFSLRHIDRLTHVSPMAHMPIHSNLMLSCHILQIDILCEFLEVI